MSTAPGTGFQRQKGFDMLVLGGGIAGLTAAWRGARLGLSGALVEQGPLFGGQVSTLGAIDDYPSIATQSGPEFASQLVTAATASGVAITEDTVVGIRRTQSSPVVETRERTLNARNVVIATGARLRRLDLPEASELEGRGISLCATCDGGLYRGRDVVVIGGGDGALQAALDLVRSCRSVTVVVRSRLRAKQHYIDAASKRSNLRFLWDSTVEAVLGDGGVTGVRVRNRKSGETAEMACFGVFPLIGVTPNSDFASAVVELTDDGYIRTEPDLATSTPGIFAIGAVRSGYSGALVSAAGEGAEVAEVIARRFRK
jgi:thioredoxin reductase (NADPH)